MPDFDDTDAPILATAPDADEQRLPPQGTKPGHRVDDSAVILIRELSLIRSAAVQQSQMISNLHAVITRVEAQQFSFEARFSSKLDDVLHALKACAGCSRLEQIEMQIEGLRGAGLPGLPFRKP